MRVLVTGASGFVGSHLLAALRAEGGHHLFGISRSGNATDEKHFQADLSDTTSVDTILAETKPEWIFHLAGYASPGKSFHDADQCWADNLGVTRKLYDSIVRAKLNPRIMFTSSGLIYGEADRNGPAFDENSVLKPTSPYACSKAATDLLGYQYFRNYGLNILRARPFNHIGPGQSPDYAIANFARQIAAIKLGKQPPIINTGNLSAERDLTDVRDIVAAYLQLMKTGQPGEAYNLGQGKTVSIASALSRLIELADIHVEVVSKDDPSRATDTATVRVNTTKANTELVWVPTIPFERTLSDTLAYWLAIAGRS